MFNLFNKSEDGKAQSFDQVIGGINTAISMLTGGEKDLQSLTAEYMPQIVAQFKEYQEKHTSGSLAIMIALSEDLSYLIVSIYEIGPDGVASVKHAFPLNNITELLLILKNLKDESNQVRDTAESNTGHENGGTGIEGTGTGTGANSAG